MLLRSLLLTFFAALLTLGLWAGDGVAASNPCNPCASNPCAANPCASNPCAANPCGSNPCAANPCGSMNACSKSGGNTPIRGDRAESGSAVLAEGTVLWSDASLGRSGLSCATCHPDGKALNAKPYPKYIEMAMDVVTLDQMINFCMKNPMGGDYLKWNSREMTALAAYVAAHSGKVNPCATNPCNPCGAKNACNPCGY